MNTTTMKATSGGSTVAAGVHVQRGWDERDANANDNSDDEDDDEDDEEDDEEATSNNDDDDDEEDEEEDNDEAPPATVPEPSTPVRGGTTALPALRLVAVATENWDDDFEDGTDSPRQPILSSSTTSSGILSPSSSLGKIPPTPSSLRGEGHRSHTPSTSRTQSNASQIENWDDEFGSRHSSPGTKRTRRQAYLTSSDNSDDDEEGIADEVEEEEFGFNDREEDRTVTARSRQAAMSRLHHHHHHHKNASPPPPLPPLTHALFVPEIHNQPLPRSPTTSVFSVPPSTSTSNRDSFIAGYSFSNSLTHLALRPTTSRTSGRASLSNLPPSPPIHKARGEQRERRRLRKKSRPPRLDDDVYEMPNLPGRDMDDVFDDDDDIEGTGYTSFALPNHPPPMGRDATPPLLPLNLPRPVNTDPTSASMALPPREPDVFSSPPHHNHNRPTTPPPQSTPKSPLLQRIGSVKKKWAVRRKRASTAPSEVGAADFDNSAELEEELEMTPRPPSSVSSSHYQSSPTKRGSTGLPPHAHAGSGGSSSWFFRGGGGGAGTPLPPPLDHQARQQQQMRNTSNSTSLLLRQTSRSNLTSSSPGGGGSGESSSPTKLVKRKSFGFVQIRKSIKPDNGSAESSSPQEVGDSGRPTMGGFRHVSYSGTDSPGLGLGRSPSSRSRNATQGRIIPSSSTTGSSEGGCSGASEEKEGGGKEGEGRRGFMGSVRRISLGKKKDIPPLTQHHKRTKSTLSTAGMPIVTTPPTPPSGKSASAMGEKDRDKEPPPPLPTMMTTTQRALSPTLRIPASRSPSPMLMARTPDEEDEDSSSHTDEGEDVQSSKGKRQASASASSSSSAGGTPASANVPLEDEKHDKELHRTGRTRTGTLLPAFQLQTPAPTIGRTSALKMSVHRDVSGMPGQAASLGRSTMSSAAGTGIIAAAAAAASSSSSSGTSLSHIAGGGSTAEGGSSQREKSTLRRNSLGDLKIPARITQAQVGLRRDLMMVKEFAANVGQLKELQDTYHSLVTEMNTVLDAHHHHAMQVAQAAAQAPLSPPTSPPSAPSSNMTNSTTPTPSLFKPKSRQRSNTNPQAPPQPQHETSPHAQTYKQLVSAFYTINSRYRISWECAELLVELGGGATASTSVNSPTGDTPTSAPPLMTSTSEPTSHGTGSTALFLNGAREDERAVLALKKGRERAVTLAGEDASRPVTPLSVTNPSSLPSTAGVHPPHHHHHHHHHHHAQYNPSSWRASTGRNDLSSRQLLLLKEMLHTEHPTAAWDQSFEDPIPEEAGSGSVTTPSPLLEVNRDWRWGHDAMGSTITLPASEESAGHHASQHGQTGQQYRQHQKEPSSLRHRPLTPAGHESEMSAASPSKKRRSSRLGMSGLRDMLRSLKRGNSETVVPSAMSSSPRGLTLPFFPPSTTSLSTESSSSQHQMKRHLPPRHAPPLPTSSAAVPVPGRRRAKTSTEPGSVRSTHAPVVGRPTSPFNSTSLSAAKPSPRRPSIASIFRLGKGKSKNPTGGGGGGDTDGSSGASGGHRPGSSNGEYDREEEEDWDRMDVPMDEYDEAAKALGIGSRNGTATTVRNSGSRGRSPYIYAQQLGCGSGVASRVASSSSIAISGVGLPTPGTPRRASGPSQSQTSLVQQQPGGQGRLPRLSNVEEYVGHGLPPASFARPMSSSRQSSRTRPGSSSRGSPRVPSRKLDGTPILPPSSSTGPGPPMLYPNNGNKTGSVRSMPYGAGVINSSSNVHYHSSSGFGSALPDPKLAMTPENIRPLLENTKEVHARLVECIREVKALLDAATENMPALPAVAGVGATTSPASVHPPTAAPSSIA